MFHEACKVGVMLRLHAGHARAGVAFALANPGAGPHRAAATLQTANTRYTDHIATCPICTRQGSLLREE
jgi:hypothetical protein